MLKLHVYDAKTSLTGSLMTKKWFRMLLGHHQTCIPHLKKMVTIHHSANFGWDRLKPHPLFWEWKKEWYCTPILPPNIPN